MWIKREIEPVLKKILAQRPAVVLTGSRQSGKTSLLRKICSNYHYVTLDLPLQAEEAEESGKTFLQKNPVPLVVDEVQYAPKLLRYIKEAIDSNRDKNGQFCLTGSQKFSLMERVTESLAGRSAILSLFPLSAGEFSRHYY